MAIADEMKNLAEEIVASYGARVAAVGEIVKETRQTLRGFQANQRRMAEALKTGLAQGESQRLEAFKVKALDIKKLVDAILKETAELLSDFRKEQKEMAEALRGTLAKGESARLDDFRAMFSATQRRQKERVGEVQATLREFRKDQEEAHRYWWNLTKGAAARRTGRETSKLEVAKPVAEKVEEAEEEKAAEIPPGIAYRDFFAYWSPKIKGVSNEERMKEIGRKWGEYKRARG